MRVFSSQKGWISSLLVAAIAVSSLAPAAEAGRRYKRHHRVYYATPVVRQVFVPQRVRYVEPVRYSSYRVVYSDAGPVFAGFLGGLFLGATLANVAPAGYEYYDPYCGVTFVSLRAYHAHLDRGCGHESVVYVRECGGHGRYSYRGDDDDQGEDWDD